MKKPNQINCIKMFPTIPWMFEEVDLSSDWLAGDLY